MRCKLLDFVCLMLALHKYTGVSAILMMHDTQNGIDRCVSQIYATSYESRTFFVNNLRTKSHFSLGSDNNTVEIFSQNNFKAVAHLWKFQMFVLLVENVSNFENLFALLSKTRVWDARAKFLVAYFGTEDIGDIFRISWRYYVININVVAGHDGGTNVYTYFPYSNGNRGEYTGYEKLSDCKDLQLAQMFPQKIPLDLNGCEVRAMPYVIPPYVINYTITRDEPGKAGIEITIIRNVAKRMNFTIHITKHNYSHWGYRYPDGNYSLMYKDLLDRKTDIVFGFTYGNASYSKELDASFSHLSDSSVWYFPMAVQMPQWKNLTLIFEPILWFAIFSMMMISALSWWIISRFTKETHYRDLVLCIMSSFYILLQGSVDNPHTWKVRFIFVPWLVTCVLIFTAHQCQLISILTSPLYERQMTTLQELLDSRMEFGFYPTINEAYMDNTALNRAIFNQYQTCPLTPECLNRTAFTRQYAVVKNRRQALYLMPRYYTYPNGRVMLYDTNIAAFNTRERYYVRKGYPLLDRFDGILMLMSASGLITKWDKELRFHPGGNGAEATLEPLSLGHLQGAFMIYSLGATFAIFILVCERICSLCCRINRKYQQQKRVQRLVEAF